MKRCTCQAKGPWSRLSVSFVESLESILDLQPGIILVYRCWRKCVHVLSCNVCYWYWRIFSLFIECATCASYARTQSAVFTFLLSHMLKNNRHKFLYKHDAWETLRKLSINNAENVRFSYDYQSSGFILDTWTSYVIAFDWLVNSRIEFKWYMLNFKNVLVELLVRRFLSITPSSWLRKKQRNVSGKIHKLANDYLNLNGTCTYADPINHSFAPFVKFHPTPPRR